MSIKTRFAPSPSGYLHIGGARTALLNWALARKSGGKFLLRVEDTNEQTTTDQSIAGILEAMQWLGLSWDEGPLFQSKRRDLHLEHAARLVEQGRAYRCTCSAEQVEQMRQSARERGDKPMYDGTCRELGLGPDVGPHVIRFKMPQEGVTAFHDHVKGDIEYPNNELDDFIIVRSDGSPTYNFVVVIDDALMGVNFVLRGEDHLNNTPKQVQLYNALGFDLPQFAHMPLTLGKDGKKLSKRHGAVSIQYYRDEGYLPQAVVNFLARLGWASGDLETFTPEQFVEAFDVRGIGRSPGVFDVDKLTWLNGWHIRQLSDEQFAAVARPFCERRGFAIPSDEWFLELVKPLKERTTTLVQMTQLAEYFFAPPATFEPKAVRKNLAPESADVLEALAQTLESVEPFEDEPIEQALRELSERLGLKLGKVAQPCRVIISGRAATPPITTVLRLIGREQSIERIRSRIDNVRDGSLPLTEAE
ncbi:MAG: glutamate--tRNA ligase [Candidatus Alcyoniella australis]|nr:glutamate--tRNA ligase [Candidatus Alcyoniella australis]